MITEAVIRNAAAFPLLEIQGGKQDCATHACQTGTASCGGRVTAVSHERRDLLYKRPKVLTVPFYSPCIVPPCIPTVPFLA